MLMTLILHEDKATFTLYNYRTKKNYINWNYDIEKAKKLVKRMEWNGYFYELMIKG